MSQDSFIHSYQHSLVEGRRVRVERRSCRDCGGSGDDGIGYCERCEGTGIYSERTLYCHDFIIAGNRYSFHSYEEPVKISSEPGEDKEQYGGRFSEDEIKEFMLPMSGLLRMFRYVAAAIGFGKRSDLARNEREHVQDEFKMPVKIGSSEFREEDNSHPANCFCQFGTRQ